MTDNELKELKDTLWHSADILRASAHLAANKYGQPILGLIFLRYADILFKQNKAAIEAEYNRLKGGRMEKSIKEISIEKCGFYLPECNPVPKIWTSPRLKSCIIQLRRKTMGRGKLTTEEQAILRANPNVKSVNDQCIFYTAEFKKHFIEALTKGKRPKQIFVEAGFDLEILGDKRIERATARWKERHIRDTILASIGQEAAKEALHAIDAIDDLRKAKEQLTKQEKIIQQQAAEIEALKKSWLARREAMRQEGLWND